MEEDAAYVDTSWSRDAVPQPQLMTKRIIHLQVYIRMMLRSIALFITHLKLVWASRLSSTMHCRTKVHSDPVIELPAPALSSK